MANKIIPNLIIGLLLVNTLNAQQQIGVKGEVDNLFNRAFNQNSSRSNHTRRMNTDHEWQFGFNIGASLGLQSNEASLFRGNGLYTSIKGEHFWGAIGLGVNMGIINCELNTSAINKFMIDRKIPQGSTIRTSPSQNSFLMVGPSFRFGNLVQVIASVNGGLLMNQGGSLFIGQQGAVNSIYRFDAGSKNIFPGLNGAFSVSYRLNGTSSLMLHADYLYSSSSVRLFDPQQGIDIPVEQKRNFQSVNTGISFVKTFGSKSTRNSSMDLGSDIRPNGRLKHRRGNSDDYFGSIVDPQNSRLKTKTKSNQSNDRLTQNCGPVTIKTQLPDGRIEEKVFSCLSDAMRYENKYQDIPPRTSANRTPNEIYPDKADTASLYSHTIYGRIFSVPVNNDIITNISGSGGGAAAASYAATGKIYKPGFQTNFYAREKANSSYRLIFSEAIGTEAVRDSTLGKLQNISKGAGNENPLNKSTLSGDFNSDTFDDFAEVQLIDRKSGAVVASTRTNENGEYWFANLPNGDYVVTIVAAWISKKGYDYYMAATQKKISIAGQISVPAETWQHIIQVDGEQFVQYMPLYSDDADGDGGNDLIVGSPDFRYVNSFGSFSNSASNIQVARPGNPIGGLNIKGGKNPGGGSIGSRITNSSGEFEFRNLTAGDYRFTASLQYILNDITDIDLTNQGAEVYSSGGVKIVASHNSQSLKTGSYTPIKDNGPKVTVSQNSQSLRLGLTEMNSHLDILQAQLNQETDPGQNANVQIVHDQLLKIKSLIDMVQTEITRNRNFEVAKKLEELNNAIQSFQELINKMGGRYIAIFNTIKVKHETVKNSIQNIR
jgi:hypothetical protein